jgi:DNA-binding HxlR family transcriptional regulator
MIYLAILSVMADGRTYGDSCGIARALDLIGERWALLVTRELLLGPKRFTDLRAGLPNLSPDVLAQRLRGLEREGIIARRTLPAPAASKIYELTARGHELEPVLLALGRWGSQAPIAAGSAELGVDALAIALKTMFDPVAAGDTDARYQLRLGDQPFALQVTGGRLELARGLATAPEVTIETDPATLAGLLWHGRRLQDALQAGALTLSGRRTAVLRFLRFFPQKPAHGYAIGGLAV